jgi:hypothetical protein
MRRLSALAVLMWVFGPALAAEKLAPLDAEFLDYLASFGGDEEDWELFADEQPVAAKPSPPAKESAAKTDPASKTGESKTEAAAKPAEKR